MTGLLAFYYFTYPSISIPLLKQNTNVPSFFTVTVLIVFNHKKIISTNIRQVNCVPTKSYGSKYNYGFNHAGTIKQGWVESDFVSRQPSTNTSINFTKRIKDTFTRFFNADKALKNKKPPRKSLHGGCAISAYIG